MTLERLIEQKRYSEIISYVHQCAGHCDEASSTDVFLRTPLHVLCKPDGDVLPDERSTLESTRSINVIRFDAIKAVIEAYPEALTEVDEDGRIPLHCACMLNRVEPLVVEALLSHTTKETQRKECFGMGCNKSPFELVRRMRTRGQRHTPLHELCYWADWTYEIPSMSKTEEDDEDCYREKDCEYQVLKMLLRADPLGGLVRNRRGLTPIYLVFGRHYDDCSPNELKELVRQPTTAFRRRWKAVEAILISASNASKPFNAVNNDEKSDIFERSDDFLFLHATLSLDRTYPVFDVIVEKYGALQSSVRGTENGFFLSSCASESDSLQKNVIKGDYPLALAARSKIYMHTVSNNVISSLAKLYPSAASEPTSKGSTVLLEAIKEGKSFNLNVTCGGKGNSDKFIYESDGCKGYCPATCHSGSLGAIIKAFPDALQIPDKEGLFPFMAAAAVDPSEIASFEITSNSQLCLKVKDYRDGLSLNGLLVLNNTYSLLRMKPELIPSDNRKFSKKTKKSKPEKQRLRKEQFWMPWVCQKNERYGNHQVLAFGTTAALAICAAVSLRFI